MTGIYLVLALGVLGVVIVAVVLARRGSSGRPRDEFLGAPRRVRDEPLIRPESRHHDTPAGADLDTPGGREHGRS